MKTAIEFAHLHVHSDYSLCNSIASVMALADRAEELGMKYLALTDYGVMFGVMDFIEACNSTIDECGNRVPRKNPIHPVIGCEVYVTPGSRFEKKGTENENKLYHLILLASGRQGYLNLIKLCSLSYTEGFYYRPRVDYELLSQYREGIIALSACVHGEIPQLILEGKTEKAEQRACYYRDLFGENNFYLELSDQGIPAEALNSGLSQKDLNKAITAISLRTGIPLVATNNVHYINQEDAAAHDTLHCIGTAKMRTDENRKKYYGDQFYFKNGEEMTALFPDYPEAIANTVRIAERCVADVQAAQAALYKPNSLHTPTEGRHVPMIDIKDLPEYLPQIAVPPGFSDENYYLCHLAAEGLAKRYPEEKITGGDKWDTIQKRLDYELEIIIKCDFSNYFLIVADYVNWAREHDIPVGPGRGAGAGSVVAYALRITDIDPLKYDLLFERFINLDFISMPDFDIDFSNKGRDEVIRYITEKYGKDHVGQIITFGKLGAKAVIKDVGRVLGISIKEQLFIAGLIPCEPGITLEQVINEEPELQELKNNPLYTELFEYALKLEGLHRHSSVHAAGVVIGKSALDTIVPLCHDARTGAIATQYDMNHLEKCGLVKFDILGHKTLDIIKHTEKSIRRRGGEYADFNIEKIPEDDPATFKLFTEGNTDEVFQFESDGMKNVLKQAKPETIANLIALNALYRPGPMANIPQFIDSKNGKQETTYPDSCLEDILKETYGVIVYQEQIMRIIRRITGFSLGEADNIRRAIGKKRKEILDREKEKFITGAISNGFEQNHAASLFDILIPFAGYSFNKSHAAAYTRLAYQTAYLKANFPEEYMKACEEFK